VAFPEEIQDEYHEELISAPDDTDWFVHQLYDFVSSMGVTIIHAVYSRWVIDLNRDPSSKPLYTDGRIITGLCPTTDFLGRPLYKDSRHELDPSEIAKRLDLYFHPYHNQIQTLLNDTKKKFGKALLWDCHSIRRLVRTIQENPFPDLILGDVDGASADRQLTETTLDTLRASRYTVGHNHPFKGGYITRHFGNPHENVHALQLEMTKVNYMNDDERTYDQDRAGEMRVLLRSTFESLIQQMSK
jgi:N-formylglutamate deformylase